jgi:hypothetical protein
MPKTYRVFMTAFGRPGEIRTVDIPDHRFDHISKADHESLLNEIYLYGQNDSQPRQHPSVSMGDIIEIKEGDDTTFYLVKAVGFHRLTMSELIDYMHTDRQSRSFHLLVR